MIGEIINLMRGDTYVSPIIINIGNKLYPEYYKLQENDCLYFGLMEPNQAFEDAVIKKKFTFDSLKDDNEDILLTLKPEDTENLLVGKYYYMVKLLTKDEYDNDLVRTIYPPTLFYLEGNNASYEKEVNLCQQK